MEKLPDPSIFDQTIKKEKRRKRLEKDSVEVAHVVVTTKPLQPKIAKPQGKKLRRRLVEFEQENENLSKTIYDKNREISALKRSVDSLNEVLNSVPLDELRSNSSIASSKILDLSRKNRSMRAELEQMKNRVNKKDAQIEKLERELKLAIEKTSQSSETSKVSGAGVDIHTKMSNVQQRLFETRNKNIELQQQLKLAQKCLQQEVGDAVNINAMFSGQGTSNWRGRAQQILALQQKLQEMRARLEAFEERMPDRAEYFSPMVIGSEGELNATTIKSPNSRSQISLVGAGGDAVTAAVTHTTPLFDRFAPSVRKSEILHKAKVEALEKEIANLQGQLEEQRSKVLALKVRNKTINDEMIKYKLKTSELEEQTDYNGINVQSMNERISKQRLQYENRLEDVRSDLNKMTEERDTLRRQMEELSDRNLELEASVRDKQMLSEQLQTMVKKLETDLRAISGGFLFSCREFRKEEFVSILDALEVEKNQLVLYNKKLNERLDAEREKQTAATEHASKQRGKITRLENKIRELEKELDVQTDRKRRSQRMADYANSLSRNSLTGSVSSFTFENATAYTSTASLNQNNEPRIEDLKNQLELAKEKITLLTEKLNYIIEEKKTDAKFFEETLINSKTVILDTIISQRDGSSIGSATAATPSGILLRKDPSVEQQNIAS